MLLTCIFPRLSFSYRHIVTTAMCVPLWPLGFQISKSLKTRLNFLKGIRENQISFRERVLGFVSEILVSNTFIQCFYKSVNTFVFQ